ncbi:MAG: hypothetical protein HUJ76_11260 [Parasporobacterium sp.]|nr:hypothetical protein [Parasporobacterium sp.]
MTIHLYNNSSDSFHLVKEITPIITLNNVHPVAAFDVEGPEISIGSVDFSQIQNVNYAYIPEYNRYYYVAPPSVINNKVLVLSLSVDVLMSFSDSIKKLKAIVGRQEKDFNLYLPDPEFKVYSYTNKKTIKFSRSPFKKDADFLLTVSGGS